jgi:hypothetical protein
LPVGLTDRFRWQIVYKVAVERARPKKPEDVHEGLWALMERCWAHDPAARPTFVEIQAEMAKLI